MKKVSGGNKLVELLKFFIKMSKKYINFHSVRYHRPTEHCSSQQNQWNPKLFICTHMPHMWPTQTPKGKTKRQTTHFRKYHSALPPWSWDGGRAKAWGDQGREHKQRHSPKSCIPRPPTKKNSFVTWMTEDVLMIILFFKTKNYKARRQTYIPGLSQW